MTNRRSSAGQTSSAAAAALAVQTNLANFVNEQDPRSLFWMVSQMNDQPLDQLAAVQVDQLRQALLTRTEIDVNHWKERIQSFLAGPIHEIDWTPFAGLAPAERPAAQPQPEPVVAQSPEPRGAPPNVAGVAAGPERLGQSAAPSGAVELQILQVLQRLEQKLDAQAEAAVPTTDLGKKRHRAKALLDGLRDLDVRGDEVEDDEEEPALVKKKAKKPLDVLEAVRRYYDGSQPLTERQHLVRLELQSLPLTSVSAYFQAMRKVGSTIDSEEGEFRRFTESMGMTESLVANLFGEAVGQYPNLSAKQRDSVEAKFVMHIKNSMISKEKFNFVKAAAEAQHSILKDLKDIGKLEIEKRHDDRRFDRRGFDRGGIPTCFECGRKGHKSFECKADEATRAAHKEARAKR